MILELSPVANAFDSVVEMKEVNGARRSRPLFGVSLPLDQSIRMGGFPDLAVGVASDQVEGGIQWIW
jgi:hypothetical protein